MKKKIDIFKEIMSWVTFAVVLVAFVFTIYHAYLNKDSEEGFFIFGYRPVYIMTGSMEPYLMTNGIAITKEVDSIDDIEVGDVITFHLAAESGDILRITHRITNIDNGTIYTKGDNNRVDDGVPLTIENVEAKVTHVFNQTAWIVAKWQSGTAAKVMMISFVAAIIMLYWLVKTFLRDYISEAYRKKRPEISE